MALIDGFIWSELGSAWPQAGGSYVFLQKLFKGKFGKIMSFLYVLQTSLHLPLVMTSAAIGFINYFGYLVPLNFWQGKLVMVGLVLLIVFLLYRGITDISKIGMVLSVIVVGLLLWTIYTGYMQFDNTLFQENSILPEKVTSLNRLAFWFIIGNYTSSAIYSYLGYYNVSHIGSEIKNAEKNIPKSILISIVGIATLYIGMQWTMAGALDQSQITDENIPIISILFQQAYGDQIASFATVLLLIVAGSSLFALMLGYSRIIYAAARDGMHFKIFSHLHPTKNFPDYVLLIFGGISIVFCLLFSQPSTVFSFIVITQIFIQFIPQAIGVIYLRIKKRTDELNFKIPLYPILPIASIITWTFIFITSGIEKASIGVVIIIVGLLLYYLFIREKKQKSP